MKKLLLSIAFLTNVVATPFHGVYTGAQSGLGRDRMTIVRDHQESNGFMEKNVSMKSMTLGLHSGFGQVNKDNLYSGLEWAINHTAARHSRSEHSFEVRHGTKLTSVRVVPKKIMDLTMAAKLGYNAGRFLGYGGFFTGLGLYKVKVLTEKNGNTKSRQYSDIKLMCGPLVGASFAATDKINVGIELKIDLINKNADNKKNKFCDRVSTYNVNLRVNYLLP